MHDGSLATLEEVVDFYDGGGERNANLVAPFSLGDPTAVRALFQESGFDRIEVKVREFEASFPYEEFVEKTERAYAAVIPEFAQNPTAFDEFVRAVTEEAAPPLEASRRGNEIRFAMPTLLAEAHA